MYDTGALALAFLIVLAPLTMKALQERVLGDALPIPSSTSVAAWLSSGVDVSYVEDLNFNTSVIRCEVIDGVVCLVLLLCCEV